MAKRQRKTHFRGQERRGRRVEVHYRTVSHGELGPAIAAVTRNIGVGGAFIDTADPCPPGTRLQVTLPGDGTPLVVDAEVRWIVDGELDPSHGMGLKFLGLESEALHALHERLTALPFCGDLEEML